MSVEKRSRWPAVLSFEGTAYNRVLTMPGDLELEQKGVVGAILDPRCPSDRSSRGVEGQRYVTAQDRRELERMVGRGSQLGQIVVDDPSRPPANPRPSPCSGLMLNVGKSAAGQPQVPSAPFCSALFATLRGCPPLKTTTVSTRSRRPA